ncbi:MAG: hypothetical protein O6857_08040 [Nitrospinae bacterium]|nr:hypothetical protein [Nitrospinota bacterium]
MPRHSGRLCFLLLWFAVQCFCATVGYAVEEQLDTDQARRECFQGKTIYCLALGMAEEKAGHPERALEVYRSACKNHRTPGHLRACTPLLNLARQMDRLEAEAAPLEARCQEGHTDTCFYLGKEYLKIAEIKQAARHLTPLCRNGFRPPDPEDYGSCYHLAKGFEQTGQWHRARELYQLDCDSTAGPQQPACLALRELAELETAHSHMRQQGIRNLNSVEAVLLFVVLMSCLHIGVWFKGGTWGLKYLSRWAPLVIWSGAMAWIYWPGKPEYPANQWAVIFFVLLLAMGMAVFAHRNLQASPTSGAPG